MPDPAGDAGRRRSPCDARAPAVLLDGHSAAAGARSADPDARVLGVTACDLYVPVLTFVFGEAQLDGNCAVVSTARLHEEFYGLPAREDLLRERLVKEAAHELGHTFGLRHCADWRCVMASSHAVERLDVKGAEFCAACRKPVVDELLVGRLPARRKIEAIRHIWDAARSTSARRGVCSFRQPRGTRRLVGSNPCWSAALKRCCGQQFNSDHRTSKFRP